MVAQVPMARTKKGDQPRRVDPGLHELPSDETLRVELHQLTSTGDRREISRAATEAEEVVSKAQRADFVNIKLLEQGRCPECQGRTENFLFTVVCPACGWFRRNSPPGGHSVVYLATGEEVHCDHVYRGGNDEVLCIRDGVVISEVMRTAVRKIDHVWEEDELARARDQALRLREGICAWCEKVLDEEARGLALVDYVAFGAYQDRFQSCSEKCQKAFRKHYPSRVHRNCYEVDCNTCEKCIKRYTAEESAGIR